MFTPPAKQMPEALKKYGPAINRDLSGRVALIILAIATVAALWPVCTNDFTAYDDPANVSSNPKLNPVSLGGVLYFWSHPYKSEYIPLSYTVWGALALIARVSPDADGITLNPYIFHSANLLLHLAATIATYQLLRLLTARGWAALMGALLFALHPIQVESVAWVTGLKDVLCGALSIFALWQYLLSVEPPNEDVPPRSVQRRAMHYGLATAALVLALLAKSTAVTIPVMAILLDRVFLRRPWRHILVALTPWLILALACSVVAKLVHPILYPADGGRLWARPLLASTATAFYFYKLAVPFRFAPIYQFSPDVLLSGHLIWFAWTLPAAIAIAAWLNRKRWPWLLGCVMVVFVAMVPVSGLVPFEFEGHSLVADRYFYVAMIGPAIALSSLLSVALQPKIVATLCAILLIALGVCANVQTGYWRDTVALFSHELTVNPRSWEAYNSLSAQALAHHDPQNAERLARESIRIQPRQIDAYVTTGAALVAQGRTQEAIPIYLFAYQYNPHHSVLLNNLAGILAMQFSTDPLKLAEAEHLAREALQDDPYSASAHYNLSIILSDLGRLEEALREAQAGVQINAGDPQSQTNLAELFEKNHQHAAAMEHAGLALQLNPDYAPARQLLAKLTHSPG